jgi:glucose-6-phosphate isomerase
MISGKTTRNIMSAILEGTKTAYRKNGIPFTEIALSSLSEHELGAFLQFKMMEMKYLGKLLNVNVFDQPNVEEYKEETRRRLEGEAR